VLRSVANFTREDAREFLEVAADIPIEPRTETFPLAEARTALDRLASGDIAGSAVLVV
jgi:propanol-preferring alcohol dehydrogenase